MSGAELRVEARLRAGFFELDVAFTARPGVTVLFGPSASGKTLTLRAVAGLERVSEGTILRDGAVLDAPGAPLVAPRERRTGYAPQDAALWPHRSAREHLSPFCDAARAAELLDAVGLSAHADRRPARLSGGERQRLALARAIAHRPEVLLLDEPFAALDDTARRAMGDLVRAEAARGALVLFVTHDRDEALRLGDAFVLYDAGRARQGKLEPVPPAG